MKYLFVTWDGGGNLAPELLLAGRLVGRGHEVRFLGHRSQRDRVEAAGCRFSPFERAPDGDASRAGTALFKDWEVSSPPKLVALARERLWFGPAADFAADVLAVLDRHRADVVAVDWMLFGALAAAERSGLPSAALWHTAYSLPTLDVPPFGPGFGPPRGWPGRLRNRGMRVIGSRMWNKGLPQLNAARAAIGLFPLQTVFEQFDHLDRVLVLTSDAFDFAALGGGPLPANVRYVGPQVELGVTDHPPAASDRPLVLVSFSTTYQAQEPVLAKVAAALGTLPVRALVSTGPAVRLDGPLPGNVEVTTWIPHTEVLPGASLVVTHAGMGTVMTSLAHGVPLVCLPMGRDQAENAARVVHAGAGLRLSPKAGQAAIAAAVRDALATPALAGNARRLARAMRHEIEADLGVTELETLASQSEQKNART